MKIRSDFVSNSSSSSFMMIGRWDEEDTLQEFVKKNYPEWIKEEYPDPDEDLSGYELIDLIEDKFAGLTLRHEIGDGSEGICLGLEYSDMKDDETKKQFEDRIKKLLSDFYKKPIDKIEICESAGYC